MKKLLFATVISSMVVGGIVGCKHWETLTPDTVEEAFILTGAAAGKFTIMSGIDNETRNRIVDVMNGIDVYLPQTNESFVTAWTWVVKNYADSKVKNKEMTETEADIFVTLCKTGFRFIDYKLDQYPDIRKKQDLLEAAVHGFIAGYLSVVKPANLAMCAKKIDYDKEAFEYFLNQ